MDHDLASYITCYFPCGDSSSKTTDTCHFTSSHHKGYFFRIAFNIYTQDTSGKTAIAVRYSKYIAKYAGALCNARPMPQNARNRLLVKLLLLSSL